MEPSGPPPQRPFTYRQAPLCHLTLGWCPPTVWSVTIAVTILDHDPPLHTHPPGPESFPFSLSLPRLLSLLDSVIPSSKASVLFKKLFSSQN